VSPLREVRLRNIRFFGTEMDKTIHEERAAAGLDPHVRPYSTLIGAMGNHWEEKCFEAVRDMAEHAWQEGIDVCLLEEADRCYHSHDALGTMRNDLYMKALTQGWEYLLYVDNDAKPEPDTLVRLLRRQVPIVSPVIQFWDGQDHGINMPKMVRNAGLVMVTNIVLSFVLFKSVVFLPWAITPFWQDALGADEDYHFRRLYMAGHRPFVDTDLVVTVMAPPRYPLDEER
jgi:hypothetical protein